MQNVAQSWLVWHLTRSALLLGVVGFFDSIPRLLLGALGGAITDRFDRRRLLILTQVLGMIQAFIYWLAVYFDFILYWHILVLACILGVVNTLNQTARQSLVNSLVPREDLSNAIALHASVFNLSRVLGPSVGGLVIATFGIAGCFFLNALSFLALILTLILMELPAWDGSSRRAGLWNEIKEGYRYLRSNSQMFAIVMLSYVVATIGAPYATFVPVFATNILHVGPLGFGLLMSAPGIGAIAAGLWLASLSNLQPNPFWVCALVLGYGIFLGLFAISNVFILSLILSGLYRLLLHRVSRIHQHVPPIADASSLIGTGAKFFLYGPRPMVHRRSRARRFGLYDRHPMDRPGRCHDLRICRRNSSVLFSRDRVRPA